MAWLAAIATLTLPHVYEAHSAFIPPRAGVTQLAADDEATSTSLPAGGSSSLLSPGYYEKIFESEALRRALIASKFRNPRSTKGDSLSLADILRPDVEDPSRRAELASKKLEKAMDARIDLKTNLVEIDVRMRWPDLAAAVTNKAVDLANELGQQHRTARARDETELSAKLFTYARSKLSMS